MCDSLTDRRCSLVCEALILSLVTLGLGDRAQFGWAAAAVLERSWWSVGPDVTLLADGTTTKARFRGPGKARHFGTTDRANVNAATGLNYRAIRLMFNTVCIDQRLYTIILKNLDYYW